MGPASDGDTPRLAELRASAKALGVHRVVHLGYADSGHGAILHPEPPDRTRFGRAETEDASERLAVILREEKVALLLSYDANGGYGHRDHVRVREVGKRAARLAGVPRVLEATLPREPIAKVVSALRLMGVLCRYDSRAMRAAYTPCAAITHRINVRKFARQKQAAPAAHRSQIDEPGRAAPVMRILTRPPVPVFSLLMPQYPAPRLVFSSGGARAGRIRCRTHPTSTTDGVGGSSVVAASM
ncbi:PIG-L family deacetylase [Streptomyces sp. ME02-8801-2C]|uniref:PIG-L deacetylase family protein n=1 Tax=Streptomyces sp. ME02-8801-2C TaxID=3028680 RepID=UPI0029B81E4E|nr:PIG-L family deacetylase [Streptomyces sp. ME02-8801-2C]MDX3455407.1 PIG-L family deacetylase [Streptomyces sp. ME02-8801-2C]